MSTMSKPIVMYALKFTRKSYSVMGGLILLGSVMTGCSDSSANGNAYQQPVQSLPVLQVSQVATAVSDEYTASLEGSRNIEIRPQVDGYLEKIFLDEGAFVHKGQPLFKINDQVYAAQSNNARANLQAAKANQESAQINVSKLTPLVQNNVVSDVQLKAAQAVLDAAKANVAQAEAMLENAAINNGFTLLSAPADGYIGRIPFKVGSLVGKNDTQPLTILSEIKDVYAYFSMSEQDFLKFKNQFEGNTVEEKIKRMPPVELVLADNSIYPQTGKVGTVEGQFDRTIGAISFRASFPNPNGLLRSGNTGKIRIRRPMGNSILVPQEATFEIQDKIFVFVLADSNKVGSRPITVDGKSGDYYLVAKGLTAGEKIVYTGLDRLKDGSVINPQKMSMDSLLKVKPQ
jgi:membrane fusion protein, multidrug efflux system